MKAMFVGFLSSILSGLCFAICFTPVRHMNKSAWENIWFVYSLMGVPSSRSRSAS